MVFHFSSLRFFILKYLQLNTNLYLSVFFIMDIKTGYSLGGVNVVKFGIMVALVNVRALVIWQREELSFDLARKPSLLDLINFGSCLQK